MNNAKQVWTKLARMSQHIPTLTPTVMALITFALTAGSVGDIIACAEIIVKVAKSFSDAIGGASDHRDFIEELSEGLRSLYFLQTFQVNIRSERYEDEARQLFMTVGEYAKTYRKAIEEFRDRYPTTGPWNLIKWLWSGPTDAAALRNKLQTQRQTLFAVVTR